MTIPPTIPHRAGIHSADDLAACFARPAPTRHGIVKAFYPSPGVGFILNSNGGPDIQFHSLQCRFLRCIEIRPGDTVYYEREMTPRGWRATVVDMDWPGDVCPCCGGRR